jgi:hypothetical protein
MQKLAGGPFVKRDGNKGSLIKEYRLGDMTKTVYYVRGGLEDWAYAAGWDSAKGATL